MPRTFAVLLLTIFVCKSSLYAQGFLHARGKQIVNEKGENVLLRGIGLGGWMLQEGYMLGVANGGQQQHMIRHRIETQLGAAKADEFYNAWLANHTTKTDIDSLKAWGFNSVRLPMHYNLYTLAAEKEPMANEQTWLDKGFALTDSLLAWCKANKMYLILDMHGAPGGQGNDLNIADRDPATLSLWQSEANQQKMIALWKKLALRYANEPWIGAYDIINEPNWGFQDTANDKHGLKERENGPLRKLMMDITNAIRQVDARHLIIIEGNGWGNNYNGIMPAWDDNMAMSFHKYWNYNDAGSIANILKYRDQYNIPVWLGETGENSNVWFAQAVHLLESNNIGWAWWPLKKLGINNPLQIKTNANYERLLAWWNGRSANQPSDDDAYSGLMELASSTKFEFNVIHRDVIDALFRQPFDGSAKPYKNNLVGNETKINAVDFDLGASGIAYFDMDTADYHVSTQTRTAGNRGGVYRNDGVDIYKDSNSVNEYYVGNIEAGEWLQFSIDVAKKGVYDLVLTVAAPTGSGQINIESDGKMLAQNLVVPASGALLNWQSLSTDIKLSRGKQSLRLYFAGGGFNIKSLQFTRRNHQSD